MAIVPISVSDILKLLDKAPEWLGLKRLAPRLDALEKRVAELEAKLAGRVTASALCPMCRAAMDTVAVVPDPTFGMFGMQRHTLRCTACGHEESRQVDPKAR